MKVMAAMLTPSRLLIAFAWLCPFALLLPAETSAAPQIDGDILIANNHTEKVVVLPDGVKLGVGVKPCFLGFCLPISVGVSVPNLLPPVNINSVLLTGNGRITGNVVISGDVQGLAVVSSGSNINSLWAK